MRAAKRAAPLPFAGVHGVAPRVQHAPRHPCNMRLDIPMCVFCRPQVWDGHSKLDKALLASRSGPRELQTGRAGVGRHKVERRGYNQ
eukprot:SAG11_NODE_16349_length_550_cov_0.691796_1_plen_86_part_10